MVGSSRSDSRKTSTTSRIDIDDQIHFVTAEYSRVCQSPVDGVYVIPLFHDHLVWKGFVMVRSGCYTGAIFRFTLTLPADFPHSETPPTLKLNHPIFHPYFDMKDHELCLGGFLHGGVWNKNQHRVSDLLSYLQAALAVVTEDCPLDLHATINKHAAQYFIRDFDNYRLRAREIVSISRAAVYDPADTDDPYAIVFSPWDQAAMEPLRRRLIGLPEQPSRSVSDFSASAPSTVHSNDRDADDEGCEVCEEEDTSSAPLKLDLISRATRGHRRDHSDLSSIDLNSARDSVPEENKTDAPESSSLPKTSVEPQNGHFSSSTVVEPVPMPSTSISTSPEISPPVPASSKPISWKIGGDESSGSCGRDSPTFESTNSWQKADLNANSVSTGPEGHSTTVLADSTFFQDDSDGGNNNNFARPRRQPPSTSAPASTSTAPSSDHSPVVGVVARLSAHVLQ